MKSKQRKCRKTRRFHAKQNRKTRVNVRRPTKRRKQRGGMVAAAAWLAPVAYNLLANNLPSIALNMASKSGIELNETVSTDAKTLMQNGLKGIIKDPELWEAFGNGNEKSREKANEQLEFNSTNLVAELTPHVKEGATSFLKTISNISTQSPEEVMKGILHSTFDTYKSEVFVAPNRKLDAYAEEIKKGDDERDLTRCVYVGNATKETPKSQIASFCLPDLNVNDTTMTTNLLCYDLAELQEYVKQQKEQNITPIPTLHYDQIKRSFPHANDNFQRPMNPIWVDMIEKYPVADKLDGLVIGLIHMVYEYAKTNIPILRTILPFGEKAYENWTPNMIKRWIRKGKMTFVYFMKNPLVVQSCLAMSKFLRLTVCVWLSTIGLSEGERQLELVKTASVLWEMVAPIAFTNPFVAIPYYWMDTAFTSVGCAYQLGSLDVGGFFSDCLLKLVKSGATTAWTSYFGYQMTYMFIPFKALFSVFGSNEKHGNVQTVANLWAYNPGDAFKEVAEGTYLKTVLNKFVGYEILSDASIGFKVAKSLETMSSPFISQHLNEVTLFLWIQLIPTTYLDLLISKVLINFAPPKVKSAYMLFKKMMAYMYPEGKGAANFFLVLYRFMSYRTDTSVLMNVYPFYELRLCGLFMHEVFLWFTDVGSCFINKMRVKWFKHDIHVDATCCFKQEVGKVRSLVLAEQEKRDDAAKNAAGKQSSAIFQTELETLGKTENELNEQLIKTEQLLAEQNELLKATPTSQPIQDKIAELTFRKNEILKKIDAVKSSRKKTIESETIKNKTRINSNLAAFKTDVINCVTHNVCNPSMTKAFETVEALLQDIKTHAPELEIELEEFIADQEKPIQKKAHDILREIWGSVKEVHEYFRRSNKIMAVSTMTTLKTKMDGYNHRLNAFKSIYSCAQQFAYGKGLQRNILLDGFFKKSVDKVDLQLNPKDTPSREDIDWWIDQLFDAVQKMNTTNEVKRFTGRIGQTIEFPKV
jgi:hypothetical protein